MKDILVIAGSVLVALGLIGIMISRLYRRTTQEMAFVRTGLGGAKVIVEGGALVLPVLQDITPVSLKTHKLEVSRRQSDALITKDSLRADVTVEFFVRVEKEIDSIKMAAQTLGRLTNSPEELKRLVEGKFVDALRSVAATMDLNELHQNRADFVQQVRTAVNEDLKKNGLELESASLVGLDQTDTKYFNPDNTFDASGLAKITQITEDKRRERFDIEQKTQISIAEREKETVERTLQLEREKQRALIKQKQEIAQAEAEAKQLAEYARLEAERQIEEKEIAKRLSIELARQKSETEVAEKSRQKSAAEAEAADERAKAVAAEQRIETARAVEIAEREKQVELVQARKQAEMSAIGITVAAQAEKDSSVTRAEAIKTVAQAEAEAEMIRADAKAKSYDVEAEGTRKVNEAQNALNDKIIEMQVRLRLIDVLPDVMEKTVKPLERIDSIKIVDVSGMTSTAASQTDSEAVTAGTSFADQIVNSSLRHRSLAPLVDHLLNHVGIPGGGSLNALTSGIAKTLTEENRETSEGTVKAETKESVSEVEEPSASVVPTAKVSRKPTSTRSNVRA